MNLDDVLSGRAKLEGVQWLLLSEVPRGALRDLLKSLLSVRTSLGPLRPQRAKFKPGRKLTAYYDALFHVEHSSRYCVRPIAVTWGGGDEAERRFREHDPAEMEAEADHRGVAAPFAQLTAHLLPCRMHISVSPLDTHFSQLVRLVHPRYVREMLAAACPASELAADRCDPSSYTVTSIRYRPGQRHVLRYDRLDGVKATVFAKLYPDEKGARLFQVARQAAEWLANNAERVAAVRPLAYVLADRVVLYPGLGGMPLIEALRHGSRSSGDWLERAGTALQTMHQLPAEITGPLPTHDFRAEVSQTARASAHIRVLLPSVGNAIDALLDRALELHDRLPQEPPTFTHGDFKAEHVWCGPGGLTLLDFDSCHWGDPALDVGKFLAHLQLWHALNDHPGLMPAQERFLAGYGNAEAGGRLVRSRLYEAVELVKITARRVPLFDLKWAFRTERLIARAQALVNALQLTCGLPSSGSHCVELSTSVKSCGTVSAVGTRPTS